MGGSKIYSIIKRNGKAVPFNKQKITNAIYKAAYAEGGHDRKRAEDLSDQVVNYLENHFDEKNPPSVEQIQDAVEKILIENGHARTAKAFIIYRNERTRERKARERGEKTVTSDFIPYRKIWETLDWSVAHGLSTIEGINRRVEKGEFCDIVKESDERYEWDIEKAAESILNRRENVRLVIIAGPSSSGKTTTTLKLARRLKRSGLNLVEMNLDNYFYDLELHPKDEYGDYDFETPQALDIPLIDEHLGMLLEGKTIYAPRYDFKSGVRRDGKTPFRLNEGDIILIDCLHGLYESLTGSVPKEVKFKFYIETLAQIKDDAGHYIRWSDTRMLRRMSRDAEHRNHPYVKTLEHWHYVRKSEMRHIIPFIHSVDYIANGFLEYELPVFKARLGKTFRQFAEKYRLRKDKRDAFKRASRINRMLEQFKAVSDTSCIPGDSLLREFIGGSSYKY